MAPGTSGPKCCKSGLGIVIHVNGLYEGLTFVWSWVNPRHSAEFSIFLTFRFRPLFFCKSDWSISGKTLKLHLISVRKGLIIIIPNSWAVCVKHIKLNRKLCRRAVQHHMLPAVSQQIFNRFETSASKSCLQNSSYCFIRTHLLISFN